MILTKQRVRIKPDNPKVWRMLGGMVDQLTGEVIEVSIPSPQAVDQRPRYWVCLSTGGDHFVSCLENELEVIG